MKVSDYRRVFEKEDKAAELLTKADHIQEKIDVIKNNQSEISEIEIYLKKNNCSVICEMDVEDPQDFIKYVLAYFKKKKIEIMETEV